MGELPTKDNIRYRDWDILEISKLWRIPYFRFFCFWGTKIAFSKMIQNVCLQCWNTSLRTFENQLQLQSEVSGGPSKFTSKLWSIMSDNFFFKNLPKSTKSLTSSQHSFVAIFAITYKFVAFFGAVFRHRLNVRGRFRNYFCPHQQV